MNRKIKEFQKVINQITNQITVLSQLKDSLVLMYLDDELSEEDTKESSELDFEYLKSIATNQTVSGITSFLLFKPLKDQESGLIDNQMIDLSYESDWFVDENSALKNKGDSMIISCWVSDSDITNIPVYGKEGLLDGIGDDPNIDNTKITIKPGTYKIDSKIRRS